MPGNEEFSPGRSGRLATEDSEAEDLTAKGAKSAKKEIGISPAKYVLRKFEGTPSSKGKKK